MVKDVHVMCLDVACDEIIYFLANIFRGARIVGKGLFEIDGQALFSCEKLIVEFSDEERLLQEQKSL